VLSQQFDFRGKVRGKYRNKPPGNYKFPCLQTVTFSIDDYDDDDEKIEGMKK